MNVIDAVEGVLVSFNKAEKLLCGILCGVDIVEHLFYVKISKLLKLHTSSELCGTDSRTVVVCDKPVDTVEALLSRTAIRRLHKARVFGWYVGISRNGKKDFDYRIMSYEEADEYYNCR